MRLTYTGLKNLFLANIDSVGTTDTNILSFFDRALGTRYQLALAELGFFKTQKTSSDTTVATQQYYEYPPGLVDVIDATVTLGSIKYPLVIVDSQLQWDRINQVLISTSAIPQFLFPRRDDYGIWPIPQAAYPIVFNYHYRDRNLLTADYTTGTVTTVNGDATIAGAGTTWTALMVGRWLSVTQDGYWYRIETFTGAGSIELDQTFKGSSGALLTYTIGESPEIPEEGHELLAIGATADWYSGPRSDIAKATWFNNVFWTGDGNNNDRMGRNIQGGLIGLKQRYAGRGNSPIVRHRPASEMRNTKIWAVTLTS